MRVAVVQHGPRPTWQQTAAYQSERIVDAAARGARVVVLPEGSLTGLASRRDEAIASSQPLDGPYVTGLLELSAAHQLCIVAHLYEAAADGARRTAYNTTVVVDQGRLCGEYRKIHLFDAQGHCESATVDEGDAAQAVATPFDVGGISLAVVTCFDLRFPELAVARAIAGATLICVPAAWVTGAHKADQWEVLVRARAIETGCVVAAAAQPGPSYCGGSMVVAPDGVVVAGPLAHGAEGIAVAEVDLASVAGARAATPTLRHRPVWGAK